MIGQLLHKETHNWKNQSFDTELYASNELPNDGKLSQAQGVCFTDPDHVVLFKHRDGYYGLPGGTVEAGETPEQALKREVKEEAGVEVNDFGYIGYVRVQPTDKSRPADYQLRYWAKVSLLGEGPQDPDGKAVSREVVPFKDAAEKLGWGARGVFLLELARKQSLTDGSH